MASRRTTRRRVCRVHFECREVMIAVVAGGDDVGVLVYKVLTETRSDYKAMFENTGTPT